MKKQYLFTACILFALILLTTACAAISPEPSKIGNVTKDQPAETKQSTEAAKTAEAPVTTEMPATAEAPAKDIYQVGDTAQVKGLKIIYTASGEYTSSNQFTQPADGKKFIFMEFYVENTGSSSSSVSYFDFDAYADGYSVDQKFFDVNALSGSISPGRWNIGRIYFEVPKNAAEIEAEYEYNILSSKKLKFAYEGEKVSGFVPGAKTTPSEGAFKPGDIIDSGKFKISYLSCDHFESDNMFIQPDEGNGFIYLEFEFENTSDSDRNVSNLLFECYADGKVCHSTSIRDDDLSATLSPGRKAKGTVAFQVPKDASVIEVEFVDNLFSGNPIIFSFEK